MTCEEKARTSFQVTLLPQSVINAQDRIQALTILLILLWLRFPSSSSRWTFNFPGISLRPSAARRHRPDLPQAVKHCCYTTPAA